MRDNRWSDHGKFDAFISFSLHATILVYDSKYLSYNDHELLSLAEGQEYA